MEDAQLIRLFMYCVIGWTLGGIIGLLYFIYDRLINYHSFIDNILHKRWLRESEEIWINNQSHRIRKNDKKILDEQKEANVRLWGGQQNSLLELLYIKTGWRYREVKREGKGYIF